MNELTDVQAAEWCRERGLSVGADFEVSLPNKNLWQATIEPPYEPHQAIYLVVVLADQPRFHFPDGGLFWLKVSGVWDERIERVGFHVLESVRRQRGDNFSWQEAPAQLFESIECLSAQACLAQAIAVGWDALFVPNAKFFVSVSHDAPISVISAEQQIFDGFDEAFSNFTVRRSGQS